MTEHLYKSFDIKANETGTISGYFSTYDREPDSYGDVIAKGAFDKTIKARKDSGHPFPLCWNHDLDQIIGSVEPDNIKETDKGPLMTASFFDTLLAQEKREIVKSGVVYQFSFAYDIIDQAEVTLEDGRKANELREIDLFEISIVPIPANQNAVMTEVKAVNPEIEAAKAEMVEVLEKAGKRNSKKDADAIREAIRLLEGVLEDEDNTDAPEEPEEEPEVNEASEEPKGADPELKARLLEAINHIEEMEE